MSPLPAVLSDVLGEVTGARARHDPVTVATGGPAGNARLTAWTGILLLALILAQLVTLLDVSGLISWHVVLGTLLVPTALLKTGSTAWRIGRYYAGHREYRTAGPPPMLLRVLGPLVVITTLGLLGSGLTLIALGPRSGRRPFVTLLGISLDPLTVHQALFIAFAVATGLHLLVRIVPALRLAAGRVGGARTVAGGRWRFAAILTALAAAGGTAALIVGSAGAWHDDGGHHRQQSPARMGVHASAFTR